jgi:hypothetical protein
MAESANDNARDKVLGYEDPISGEVYWENDRRLVGYGNPPSSPHVPAGRGRVPMQKTVVNRTDIDAEFRPSSDHNL